jgi:hypothetical protein
MDGKKSGIGVLAPVKEVKEATAEIDLGPTEPAPLIESMIKNFHKLQVDDINQQLEWRPKVLKFTAKGLVAQNIIAFLLVITALLMNRLDKLNLVFSTLIGATLLQTGYVAKVMVQFLFSDIDYHDKEYGKWLKMRSPKSK